MWLVSTLLTDHWFESLEVAYAYWQASPKTRTFPLLDSGWRSDAFAEIIR